jgi:carbon storage regulator CsrA
MDIETRRVGESIKVGEVTVTVLAVEGNEVRLGISAAHHDTAPVEEILAQVGPGPHGSSGYEH